MEKKVLLVDDSVELAERLTDFFRENSYEVTQKDTASEALKRIETEFFDLICVDYQLHQLGGMDFIRQIRESFFNAATPIFLFAVYDKELMEKVKDITALNLFSKPVDSDNVISEATKILMPAQAKKAKKEDEEFSFIDPFIEAVEAVFGEKCDVGKITKGAISVTHESHEGCYDYSSTFSIVATNILGNFTLSFSDEVADNIVKDSIDDSEAKDILLEMSVDIFQRVRDIFTIRGITVYKSMPVVIKGKSHILYNTKGGLTLSTVLTTDLGEISLEFFLSKQA